MSNYIPVIGLEVHIEFKTKRKMFCDCPADYFGKPPNSQVCPVCLGLPGALPVPNKTAVEWTILLGQALDCKINQTSKFDRKHYFYPDLPKGYQISQYDEPIAVQGRLKLKVKSEKLKVEEKTFRIHRVHLEEDTGKLIHKGSDTLIDFNRSGVPLVEIVTEPDFDNANDVKQFLEELQVIVRYLGISDADMEKGSMRLEPNISIAVIPAKAGIQKQNWIPDQVGGDKKNLPKYKVEVKNINSFRFVKEAIEFEIKRQTKELEAGKTPVQETRGFNADKGITYSQRSKEAAHDYRYFPEPDIPPMIFDDQWLKSIEKQIPELPQEKMTRFINELKLKAADAFLLTRDKNLSDYFERVISKFNNQNREQLIANIIINKRISTNIPVSEFVKKAAEILTPKQTDEKEIETLINQLIKVNKKVVEDYQKGKKNAIMFLVGLIMREMKGKADAKMVISKIINQISKINIKN